MAVATAEALHPIVAEAMGEHLANPRSVGKLERQCLDRIRQHHAEWPDKGYTFNEAKALKSVDFVERYCRHYKGEWAGKPMHLEPWQKLIQYEVFGWVDALGFRVVRMGWCEVARKNGKSQWAGAIGLYLLVADEEQGAEVYSSATKRDQAKIVFNAAKQMVRQNAALSRNVKAHRTLMTNDTTGSKFEPLSSEAHTLDGLDPHGNIVDEIHAHRTREVWDVLDTAMAARRQPLTWAITTAGIYDPEQIGWQQHEYALQVMDGVIEDDSLFVWISAADEGVGWEHGDEALQQANPNWGVSANPEHLRKQRDKARVQASFTNTFRRLHLNQWTQARQLWLNLEQWRECGGELPPAEFLATLPCWGGVDLSSKIDLTAFVLAFYDETEDVWYLLVHLFLPGDNILERARTDRVPYDRWAEQGYITLTDGNVIDYEYIMATVLDTEEEYRFAEVAFDPWNAEQTAIKLEQEGITMVRCRQGYATLSEPTKEFEKLVVSGKLRHGDHPVLTWMANNTMTTSDAAGNIKIDKAKSIKRIDGIAASIMAISRGIVSTGGTVYDDMGITFFALGE